MCSQIHTEEQLWSHIGMNEWKKERKKEEPPHLSVFLTGCYGSHPCSRWRQRIRSATLELSDRRTSSAVFGGWRQVQLRPVRLRLMAGDSGLDAGQQARIKILQHKHRRAVLSSAEAPIRLQIPIWREIHSSFHVFPRFTWQTWSPWLHRFVGNCSKLSSVSWLISQWAARSFIFFRILMDKISAWLHCPAA